MTDYKNTLNLPVTDFPMKANLANKEPGIIAFWDSIKLYEKLREKRKGKKRFILHDGPPYANGEIHLGHALNKVIKDIIIKSKTLSGFDVPYVPGWDCHGLPIELNVEKKHGKPGGKITAKAFREYCREYANSQIEKQKKDFIRLGVLGDWANPYLTMSYDFEANIIRALGRILENGYIQQGYKPVHWCCECGSALAEAEVEYEDKQSPAIDVLFEIQDKAAFAKILDIDEKLIKGLAHFVIWTTTPWTLPANQAVAINPALDYDLVEIPATQNISAGVPLKKEDKVYVVIASELVEPSLARFGITDYSIVVRCAGEVLEKIQLVHPFHNRSVPVVLGEHVTLDAGTGAVHTAPAHGMDDYHVGLAYGLPMEHSVGPHGIFHDDAFLVGGLSVSKANEVIIAELTRRGRLLNMSMIEHSYPHCWRHKTPIIFRATPQWFISMEQHALREKALDAIDQVQWIPTWGHTRIYGMVSRRPEWCISRQRSWCVPIPFFTHKATGELHPNTQALIEEVASRVAKSGIEAWYELPCEELLGEDAPFYDKSKDGLDVWFDSGVTHFCVLENRSELRDPADLYVEGSDQHRGWFQSSLLTSVAMHHRAPYQEILTHGFTVDSQGRKMSKSLGNVVSPQEVFKTLGADVLRLWVAMTDYRGELAYSTEIINRVGESYRRIRNTARFLLANLAGFDPSQDILDNSQMLSLDRWIVGRAYEIQENIISQYDAYTFHTLCHVIQNFCSEELGGFYLDVIKDRQYTTKSDSLARRSAQTAMYHVLQALVRWIAPILSFTAEEIWSHLPGEKDESVFLASWYTGLEELKDTRFDKEFWDKVIALRADVNKELENARAAGIIGSGLEAEVVLYVDEKSAHWLSALEDELRFIFITSSAVLRPLEQKIPSAVVSDTSGMWISVSASTNKKCIRCWHRRPEIGHNPQHPEICDRCIENVEGPGEIRKFA